MQGVEKVIDGPAATVPLWLDEDFEICPNRIGVDAECEGLGSSHGDDDVEDAGKDAEGEEDESSERVGLKAAPLDKFAGLLATQDPRRTAKPARRVNLNEVPIERHGLRKTIAPAADPLVDP